MVCWCAGLLAEQAEACSMWLLYWTKCHCLSGHSATDIVAFSLNCLFNSQPDGRHSKYRCKAILQRGFFRVESAHSTIKWNEQNSSDKMMCPTNNHYPLHTAATELLSPLKAKQKRGNHSVPETGKQSAAVICDHPLVNQPGSESCRERIWSPEFVPLEVFI